MNDFRNAMLSQSLMRCCKFITTGVIVASLWTSVVVAQDEAPIVTAEVNPREVYEGQAFFYSVNLQNIEPTEPKLDGFDDFHVEFIGDRSRNETVVLRRGNRKPTVIKRLGHQYQYQLTPKKTGQLTIPTAVVSVGGIQFKTKEMTVNVISAEDQDIIQLSVTTDREWVYPAQSFGVTLLVNVKSLPASFAPRNPLSLAAMDRGRSLFGGSRMRAPHLEIPWMDDESLLPELEPESDWQSILVPLGNDQLLGFRINDVPGTRSFLDVVDRTFMPPPKQVQLNDAKGAMTTYWQFEFSRRIIGKHSGRQTLEPAIIQGAFGIDNSGNSLVVDQVFAKSNEVTIEVREVPTVGRPPNYIHASGKNVELTGEIRPQTARVGDPLTLTLRLRGAGTLDEAVAPNLNSIPMIARNFRLLDPTSEMVNGDRVFTYSLRPQNANISQIPPIEATYFDVETEQFVPIATESISLTVGESQKLSANQIVAPSSESPSSNDIELSEDGLFGNLANVESFRQDRIQPLRWFAGWSGLLVSYGVAWLIMGRWQSNQSNPTRARRRQAASNANEILTAAKQRLAKRDAKGANSAIRDSFVSLVSDATGESAAGFTPREILSALARLDVPPDLAAEVCTQLERCDAGRYGSATTTMHEVDAANRLLGRLVTNMNDRGLLS